MTSQNTTTTPSHRGEEERGKRQRGEERRKKGRRRRIRCQLAARLCVRPDDDLGRSGGMGGGHNSVIVLKYMTPAVCYANLRDAAVVTLFALI